MATFAASTLAEQDSSASTQTLDFTMAAGSLVYYCTGHCDTAAQQYLDAQILPHESMVTLNQQKLSNR